MELEEKLENITLEIVASVGSARSACIEAIMAVEEGDFEGAEQLMKEAEQAFLDGHAAHNNLLEMQAHGELPSMNLLLTHAEDQLMSAEVFTIMAERFIVLYEKLYNKEI